MKWSVYEGPIRRKGSVNEAILVKLEINMTGQDRQKYTVGRLVHYIDYIDLFSRFSGIRQVSVNLSNV